jgi:hypothetical protein
MLWLPRWGLRIGRLGAAFSQGLRTARLIIGEANAQREVRRFAGAAEVVEAADELDAVAGFEAVEVADVAFVDGEGNRERLGRCLLRRTSGACRSEND